MILNPWDVQSKHIHTVDGIASSMYAAECRWGGSELYVLIEGNNDDIPKITGPLMANSHPGSYCGQDAYTDMFITEKENELLRCTEIRGVRTERYSLDTEAEGLQRCDRPGRD